MDPSPSNVSLEIADVLSLSPSQADPSYISSCSVDELYLIVPLVGDPGRCAVVPIGTTNPSVPEILNSPDSASMIISSPAVVDVKVVSSTVRLPKVFD